MVQWLLKLSSWGVFIEFFIGNWLEYETAMQKSWMACEIAANLFAFHLQINFQYGKILDPPQGTW